MPSSVFYRQFERHDHATGIKAHATTYCPGCGHGLAQKYLAEAIDELGVQDRTVLVSPVGCSVFSYYYFDVGNTQAAHGRAPAVAIGHKTANPDSIVVTYQGDGDLASIGLAEIISAAQLGIPMTVIFVNNAIYGMTGGQMAPTTLLGQHTTTSPDGRSLFAGQPLKVAELIAGLDGPVYVERVALYDNRRRTHAKRAIHKALQLQVDGVGFALIEVLSECPIHLNLEPDAAEAWVRDSMEPVFPLGVKKDVTDGVRFPPIPTPTFDAERTLAALGTSIEHPDRFADRIPLAPRSGGRQSQAGRRRRGRCADGGDAHHPGRHRRGLRLDQHPELRTGISRGDVVRRRPHRDEGGAVPRGTEPPCPGGVQRAEPRQVRPDRALWRHRHLRQFGHRGDTGHVGGRGPVVGVPFAEVARDLGSALVKNVVALGALQGVTQLFPKETFLAAIRAAVSGKRALAAVNEQAFQRGVDLATDFAQR